jgi:4-diphosphocytidyl-2-C-methyl-D-erythritol kinase
MRQEESLSVEWPAPAKLNLFLHLIGRRQDGYHLLQSVFQLLDYGDTLRFGIRADGRIRRCTELAGVQPADDLSVKAAELLQRSCNIPWGADIYLTKRLPMGGGLGGGSSDAATTLVALNYLWECDLPTKRLMALGLELGADVPVFIFGQSSWAEGIGECLQLLKLPERWYVVLKPAVDISTASVFSAAELTRNCPPITIEDFFSGRCGNVFEPIVRQRYPEVGQVLDWLDQYAQAESEGAKLTGTGSCVYMACDTQEWAQTVLKGIPQERAGFIARGLDESPLTKQLRKVRGF